MGLIEDQRRETVELKSEVAALKADMDGYRSSASSVSCSRSVTVATKLSLQLSMSC